MLPLPATEMVSEFTVPNKIVFKVWFKKKIKPLKLTGLQYFRNKQDQVTNYTYLFVHIMLGKKVKQIQAPLLRLQFLSFLILQFLKLLFYNPEMHCTVC